MFVGFSGGLHSAAPSSPVQRKAPATPNPLQKASGNDSFTRSQPAVKAPQFSGHGHRYSEDSDDEYEYEPPRDRKRHSSLFSTVAGGISDATYALGCEVEDLGKAGYHGLQKVAASKTRQKFNRNLLEPVASNVLGLGEHDITDGLDAMHTWGTQNLGIRSHRTNYLFQKEKDRLDDDYERRQLKREAELRQIERDRREREEEEDRRLRYRPASRMIEAPPRRDDEYDRLFSPSHHRHREPEIVYVRPR